MVTTHFILFHISLQSLTNSWNPILFSNTMYDNGAYTVSYMEGFFVTLHSFLGGEGEWEGQGFPYFIVQNGNSQ